MNKILSLSLVFLLVTGTVANAQDNIATHRTLIERFYQEIYNDGDTSLIAEIIADDYVDHSQPYWYSRDDIAHIVNALHTRLPDLHATIHHWYFEADHVVTLVSLTGTLDNQRARWVLMNAWRIEDGKIAEVWPLPLTAEWGRPLPNL